MPTSFQLPRLFAALAALGAGSVVWCHEPDWPDCKNPDYESQAKQNACAVLRYELADKQLNAYYKIALDRLPEIQRRQLIAEQRKWLRKLKPQCEESLGPRQDAGDGWPMEYNHCLAQATEERTQLLQRWKAR